MKIKEYQWRDGYRLDADPEAITGEFNRLRKKLDRRVQAEDVVKAAKPKNSLLHHLFEWDDSTAAQKYREDQARYIMRAVVVVYEKPDKQELKVRVIHHVAETANEPAGYDHVETIFEDPEAQRNVLAEALEELKKWRRKYAALSELAEVFATIDELAA